LSCSVLNNEFEISLAALKGVFDYRIHIRIHSEFGLRFTWRIE